MKSTTKKWITWTVTGLACPAIAIGGFTQLAAFKRTAIQMTAAGVGDYYRAIGAFKIIFVLLYLYSRTFRIGFLLLSCTLAGAMATNLSHGQSMFAPVPPLAFLWIATYLRDPSVFLPSNSSVVPHGPA